MTQATSGEPFVRQVRLGLHRAIATGELAPGARLVERDIAAEYGVSRVPVREAIRALVQDGLATMRPNRTARVREFTAEEIRDYYALREVQEGLAGRLAARRRTDEQLAALWATHRSSAESFAARDHVGGLSKTVVLHHQLLAAANSEPLSQAVLPLHERFTWTLRRNHDEHTLISEHEAIIRAIEDRLEAPAEELMRRHACNGYVILLAGLTR